MAYFLNLDTSVLIEDAAVDLAQSSFLWYLQFFWPLRQMNIIEFLHLKNAYL